MCIRDRNYTPIGAPRHSTKNCSNLNLRIIVKLLQDLLYRVPLEATVGSLKIPVNALAFDSRKVEQGGVFIALKGTLVNGHDFLDAAIAKGAVALVVEQLPTTPNPNVVWVQTSDTHQAFGLMAANYYDNPAAQLQLVGVTGTNGKTRWSLLPPVSYTHLTLPTNREV